MRWLVILFAICFSANAFAKDKPPKVGNKPLVLVKPKEPTGCKLVGTVKGTKLWAGDCVASELSPHFSRCLIECCGGLTSTVPQPAAVIWARLRAPLRRVGRIGSGGMWCGCSPVGQEFRKPQGRARPRLFERRRCRERPMP